MAQLWDRSLSGLALNPQRLSAWGHLRDSTGPRTNPTFHPLIFFYKEDQIEMNLGSRKPEDGHTEAPGC